MRAITPLRDGVQPTAGRPHRGGWPLLAASAALVALTGCQRPVAPPVASQGGRDIVLAAESTLFRGSVPRHATLDALLRTYDLSTDSIRALVDAMSTVFDPRRLRAAQPFELVRTNDGRVRHFDYEIDGDTHLEISATRASRELTAAVLPIPKLREEAVAYGSIDRETPSLFGAMKDAGERPDLAMAMADIFAGEIDFNTELQPGDRFGLLFEKFTREGRPASYGEIAAAEFRNDGRLLRAFRFAVPGRGPGYYDERGHSLRRFFLRSPLKFEPRITSGFSMGRFHPVLHERRQHLGVDYGAPAGAPVIAVAAGRVVSATFDGSNGRMVRLRHGSGYETYYLHLSAFGPDIRQGAVVEQGQIIGRVGSSGLATGPHLDFRIRKNGVFVNPVREHLNMPPGDPVPASALAAFEAARDRALGRLADAQIANN